MAAIVPCRAYRALSTDVWCTHVRAYRALSSDVWYTQVAYSRTHHVLAAVLALVRQRATSGTAGGMVFFPAI